MTCWGPCTSLSPSRSAASLLASCSRSSCAGVAPAACSCCMIACSASGAGCSAAARAASPTEAGLAQVGVALLLRLASISPGGAGLLPLLGVPLVLQPLRRSARWPARPRERPPLGAAMDLVLLDALLPPAAASAPAAALLAATSACATLGPATATAARSSAAGNSLGMRRTPASWPARCPWRLLLRLRLRRLGVPAMPVAAAAPTAAPCDAAAAAAPICCCVFCCLPAGPRLLPVVTAALGLNGGVMLLQLAKLQLLARLPARGDSPGGGSSSSCEGAGEVPRDSCASRCCRPWWPLPFLPLLPGHTCCCACCGRAPAAAAAASCCAAAAGCSWA